MLPDRAAKSETRSKKVELHGILMSIDLSILVDERQGYVGALLSIGRRSRTKTISRKVSEA